MTPQEIKEFNQKVSHLYDQGIFSEPYGIPVSIKEPVMYLRYVIGGIRGGSCWGTENLEKFTNDDIEVDSKWEALDEFLQEKCPNITYLQYRKIDRLVHTNKETEYEYYGNDREFMIKYIKLSELEKYIEELNK